MEKVSCDYYLHLQHIYTDVRALIYYIFLFPPHPTLSPSPTFTFTFNIHYYSSLPCHSNIIYLTICGALFVCAFRVSVASMHIFISVMCIIHILKLIVCFHSICEYRFCILILCAMPDFVVYVYCVSLLLWFISSFSTIIIKALWIVWSFSV